MSQRQMSDDERGLSTSGKTPSTAPNNAFDTRGRALTSRPVLIRRP